MTPTRFNFLWKHRAKARTRLEGRLFSVQTEARPDTKNHSIKVERVISINMRKALPLALLFLGAAYAGSAAALHHWMENHAPNPVSWSDCLLAPVRCDALRADLHPASSPTSQPPTQPAAEPAGQGTATLADSMEASMRKRIDLVDNETSFFKNLDDLRAAGNDAEVLSNLSLARRRSPDWFPRRQPELVQLEISIDARHDDLLALRGAASGYLNGTAERAELLTASAQLLLEEKRTDAARALLEEIIRKAPDYSPARDLLKSSKPSP